MGNIILKGLEFNSTEYMDYEKIAFSINPLRIIGCHRFKKKGFSKSPNKLLFFFHGVGGSSHVWQKQLEFFTNSDYTVILVDLFGHGSSNRSKIFEDYNFLRLGEDCLTIFDKFRVENDLNFLVGHSYGCSMATYITHNRQNQVKRLVLISGGASFPLGDPEVTFLLPNCCLWCLHPIILPIFRTQALYGSSSSSFERYISINVNSWVLKAVIVGQVWDDGDTKYHNEITVPTLLIHGENDRLVSLEEETDMKNALPRCTLHIIHKVGHMSMLKAPDEVNNTILGHFNKEWSQQPSQRMPIIDQNITVSSTNYQPLKDESINDFDNKGKYNATGTLQRKTMPIGVIVRRKSTRLSIKRANSMRTGVPNNAFQNVALDVTIQESISEEINNSVVS